MAVDERRRFAARQVRVLNSSGETIPAHSFALVTNVETDGRLTLGKPNADSIRPEKLVITGICDIPNAGTSMAMPAATAGLPVIYNGTAPANDDDFGTVNGQWYGEKDNLGFIVHGKITAGTLAILSPEALGGEGGGGGGGGIPSAGTSTSNIKDAGGDSAGSSGAFANDDHLHDLHLTGVSYTGDHASGLKMTSDNLGVIFGAVGYLESVSTTSNGAGTTGACARIDHVHGFDGTAFAGTGVNWGGGQFSVDFSGWPGDNSQFYYDGDWHLDPTCIPLGADLEWSGTPTIDLTYNAAEPFHSTGAGIGFVEGNGLSTSGGTCVVVAETGFGFRAGKLTFDNGQYSAIGSETLSGFVSVVFSDGTTRKVAIVA